MKKMLIASWILVIGFVLAIGVPKVSADIHEISDEATLTWDNYYNDYWNPTKLRDNGVDWCQCDYGTWSYRDIHDSWYDGNRSYWQWDEAQVIDEVSLYCKNPKTVNATPTGAQILAMDGDGDYTIELYDSISIAWENETKFSNDVFALHVDGNSVSTKGISIVFAYPSGWTELGEVEIFGDVPEPATMTLLLLGLPFALRRHRS